MILNTMITRLGLLLLLIFSFLGLTSTNLPALETTATEREAEQALSVLEFYTLVNAIPRELMDLQDTIRRTEHTSAIMDELPRLSQQIDQMDWDAQMAMANPNISYHQLSIMESRLVKINNRIEQINDPIRTKIHGLEELYQAWLAREHTLREYRRQAVDLPDSALYLKTIDELQTIIDSAKDLIDSYFKPRFEAGRSIGRLQTRVYAINLTISKLINEVSEAGIEQTAPSMFSAEFYDRLDNDLLRQGWDNVELFSRYQWGYTQQARLGILISLLIAGIIGFLIYVSESFVQASSRWHPFASSPIATTLFMGGAGFMFYDFRSVGSNLPPDWNTLIVLPMLIAAVILTGTIPLQSIVPRIRMLRLVISITACSLLFNVTGLPHPLYYLFVFLTSLILLTYNGYLLAQSHANKKVIQQTWKIWIWVLFLLVIIVSGSTGYDQFAIMIFERGLSVIVFTIVILLIYYVVMGLLELLIYNFPVAVVRKNYKVIANDISPIIILVLSIVWLAWLLKILWVFFTVNASLEAFSAIELRIGQLTITPELVLAVIIAGYMTLLVSHGIRAILLQETLPRYNVDRGVQLSITRLIHYAVLTIGFLVILRIIGFGLGQITIIGGALGVGIGFGLQAIVNNFVSGLILLFERPIKVGDVVVVGEEQGEVKEMGLRATTVQTFDNAEIVIPNSELITKNVTNWTLAEKRIRLRVPVGVAYGSDIEKVLEILLSCADANPSVLSQPVPRALFLAFGDSSLNFELRAWISDFNDKLMVTSELNQDIESEFELAGVEIPFPQRDLHIRSINPDVKDALETKG